MGKRGSCTGVTFSHQRKAGKSGLEPNVIWEDRQPAGSTGFALRGCEVRGSKAYDTKIALLCSEMIITRPATHPLIYGDTNEPRNRGDPNGHLVYLWFNLTAHSRLNHARLNHTRLNIELRYCHHRTTWLLLHNHIVQLCSCLVISVCWVRSLLLFIPDSAHF